MMDRWKLYWAGRSPREQRLLVVAGALAALILIWLMIGSAMTWTQQMQSASREAVEREGRVIAKAKLLARPAGAAGASAEIGNGAALDQYLAQSASELGLSLSRNEPRGADAVNIAMSQAKAQVVTLWLAELELQGMVLDNLTLTPQTDGTLGVTADLRRVTP